MKFSADEGEHLKCSVCALVFIKIRQINIQHSSLSEMNAQQTGLSLFAFLSASVLMG